MMNDVYQVCALLPPHRFAREQLRDLKPDAAPRSIEEKEETDRKQNENATRAALVNSI
jgi:hypothetical protein